MSSNYNYNYIAQLNSLNPVTAPEMSDEDLARELEFWSNTQFIEVPPGISLLDDEFQVSSTKLDQNVTQPTMMVQHDLTTLTDQTQTQQTLHYPIFFPTPNSLVPNRLQPITIATSSNDNFTPIFPATPIAPVVSTNVTNNNSVILSKETPDNSQNSTSTATKTTTDSTSTIATKTTTKTTTSTNTTTSSTSGPNRKNSSTKSNQSSASETTQSGSTETKEGEKDAELAAKLAAEEDKRRRNTAASARFRVKKKMREQALERTAREMTAKAEMFEGRVKELEMEIKWLRSLIVEKDARLLDVERPGKRKKKDESEDDNDEDDEKEKEVKREQNDQTKQKE
ncbi:hypothetical protein RclHR1_02230002 [Rhizophagus clarus]|nr:hypothetical protein RclHR1_02230002 [Rhizophagus clarus]